MGRPVPWKPYIILIISWIFKLFLGKQKYATPNCDKEDYAPEGERLYTIVDDFADNPQQWMDEFWIALQKMVENGYTDTDLTLNNINILTE